MLNIRNAVEADLELVVDVHVLAFPDFFLTKMGRAFLKVLYHFFLFTPGAIFLVLESDGIICGFAVGGWSAGKKSKLRLLRSAPAITIAVLKAALRHPAVLLRKVISSINLRKEAAKFPANSMLLRSIGVNPALRGSGAARRLLKEFEIRATLTGAGAIALTTDSAMNERAICFYLSQGYEIVGEFNQSTSRRMLVVAKTL